MPDASDPRGRAPFGWGEAFAALPLETPPADAWSRVAAHLDARDAATAASRRSASRAMAQRADARPLGHSRYARRAGWIGAATAAALALAVAWPGHRPQPAAPVHATGAAPLARNAPANVATAAPGTGNDTARPVQPAPGGALVAGTNLPRNDATAIALPKAVESARKPRFAKERKASTGAPAGAGAAPTPSPTPERLDALYAESARLEALLDLARDERVASASALLVASELDAQVAAIDARLAQPGLDDAQRTVLWRARVDALRQAAGFESTQRMLALQGAGGTLLVSVD
jgi:hypothetical protein